MCLHRIEVWCSSCGGAVVADSIPADRLPELPSLAPWLDALALVHECPGALELTTHPEMPAHD